MAAVLSNLETDGIGAYRAWVYNPTSERVRREGSYNKDGGMGIPWEEDYGIAAGSALMLTLLAPLKDGREGGEEWRTSRNNCEWGVQDELAARIQHEALLRNRI